VVAVLSTATIKAVAATEYLIKASHSSNICHHSIPLEKVIVIVMPIV